MDVFGLDWGDSSGDSKNYVCGCYLRLYLVIFFILYEVRVIGFVNVLDVGCRKRMIRFFFRLIVWVIRRISCLYLLSWE